MPQLTSFKTFPEFSKLTLEDREAYEALIKDYPPVADISFSILMLWWGTLGEAAISRLDDNLVISYWIPGDDKHSGLSIIGTERVDESICAIFDYLRERGERPRLVNVPDFVVNSLCYPELFSFSSGFGDDEYLIRVSKFAHLDNMPKYMRVRARKFIREQGEVNLTVKDIDLRSFMNRQLLLDASERWPRKGVNSMTNFGRKLLPVVVDNAVDLGVQCMGLYVEKELQAYLLYAPSDDGQYLTLHCARVNYDVPRIFEYMVHAFARHAEAKGFVYANLYSDSDSPSMRIIKIALKPDAFFRKYIIEPA